MSRRTSQLGDLRSHARNTRNGFSTLTRMAVGTAPQIELTVGGFWLNLPIGQLYFTALVYEKFHASARQNCKTTLFKQ